LPAPLGAATQKRLPGVSIVAGPLFDVLHLKFEFSAKCLSQHQNRLVSRQTPHTTPHREPVQHHGAAIVMANATDEV